MSTGCKARHQWPGLNAVVVVESRREINGKITDETRFYITSLVMLAAAVGPMIRAHWAIENSLHWVMEWSFATMNAASEPTTPQLISQPAAHRLQSHPEGSGQRFHPPPAQNRRVGRRVSRQPHRRVIKFTRFPWREYH